MSEEDPMPAADYDFRCPRRLPCEAESRTKAVPVKPIRMLGVAIHSREPHYSGVPDTGLMAAVSNPFMRRFESTMGVSISHRRPRLIVKLLVALQSSFRNPEKYQLWRSSVGVAH